MAPKKHGICQVCRQSESKYTCPNCPTVYCSVSCCKVHKDKHSPSYIGLKPDGVSPPIIESAGAALPADAVDTGIYPSRDDPDAWGENEKHMRPLTSLKWPYVPDESAYPDPLKRNDPKALQTHQYEAIATSPAVRAAVAEDSGVREVLRSIDKLRGPDRERALQRAFGVSQTDLSTRLDDAATIDEHVGTLRKLAEAIESAVRGGREDVLGLDWGDQ